MARPRRPTEAPDNTIEPTTLEVQPPHDGRPRRDRPELDRDAYPTPAKPQRPSPTDTSTVPEAVRERFLQVKEKWFFPNGDPAFKDLGNKLATKSENAELLRTLVEIANARGWSEIKVSGTQEFRRAVWFEASLLKLTARGYKPTEIDEARLVRALQEKRVESQQDSASPAPGPTPPEQRAREPKPAHDQTRPDLTPPGAPPETRERVIYGKLLAHARENYQLNPHEDISYYVDVETDGGKKQRLWGKDLERALKESLSQPKVGDRIGVRHRGEEPVLVSKRVVDEKGKILREYEVEAHRNLWTVETEAFLQDRARLAEVVRDRRIDARRAVEQHPQLAGTYVALRGAELIAQREFPDVRDQARFVETLRRTLAREIRRGDPLYTPSMRNRRRAEERAASREAPEMIPSR